MLKLFQDFGLNGLSEAREAINRKDELIQNLIPLKTPNTFIEGRIRTIIYI